MIKNGFFYFWLKNIRTSFLIIILIIIAGIFSLYSIPKESNPDIKFGIINVAVTYLGVDPVLMDSLITDEIEKVIENLEGVKEINSTSSVGTSLVTVELETGVNIRDLLTDIKDKVDNLELPEDASDPTVVEVSSNNVLLYEALLYGDADVYDDFTLMQKAKSIKTKLEGIPGISSIDIGGLIDPRGFGSSRPGSNDYDIKVLLSKSKVELLGLSILDISNKIRSNNKDFPIGNYRVGDLSYDFRFKGEFSSIDELKNITILSNGSSTIKLEDIAEFKTEYSGDTIRRLGFYQNSGKNYTSIVFNKSDGANVFKSSRESKEALENLIKNNPEFEGLSIEYSKDMSELIKEDYEVLGKTALTTIVLVFLTILFFVGFTEGIIASLLIPLAFFITFIVLNSAGLSMNFLTNFSLVLTLGIAIDTVIVIIEGASEKIRIGFTRKSAIMLAIRDFKSPLISGTSTTLVAFLPLIFLPGIIGKFLSFIPITVFITLIAALFLSLTVASALFATIQRPKKTFYREEKVERNMREDDLKILELDRKGKIEKNHDKLSIREKFLFSIGKIYEKVLFKVFSKLIYKLLFVFFPIILLIGSFLFLSPRIGFTLFPATDQGVINIDITGKTGSKEDFMKQYISDIDNIISNTQEVKVYYITVSSNSISVYIDLINKSIRDEKGFLSVADLEPVLDEKLSYLKGEGLEVSVSSITGGPPTGSAVGVKLVSSDSKNFDTLKNVSEDFENYLKSIDGTKNVSSSSSNSPGQFVFEFDKEKLASIGLNPDDILNELYFYTNGVKAGSIKQGGEDNEIIVSFKEFETFLNPKDISNIIIKTKAGFIRVGDFASFKFKKSVNNISRIDGRIVISVNSEVKNGFLPTDIQPKLDDFAKNYNYPEGISFVKSGETEENSELIVSTFMSLFIAIFLIFSILVFQFNSFSQPIIVLYSIILALLGVNIGLFVTGNPYSMPFGIGFIALTGIVVNDAIILIDRINKQVHTKLETVTDDYENSKAFLKKNLHKINYIEQVIIAGKSRLQPIIVTTLTTVFGVLPLALQDEFWSGLGFTVIFGLFVGSFMTLVVVPILYQFIVLRGKK